MNKYTHSKESIKPLRAEQKRTLDIRKIVNQTTVERIYGFFTPKFGGSLGSTYNSATGAIGKNKRAQAVA